MNHHRPTSSLSLCPVGLPRGWLPLEDRATQLTALRMPRGGVQQAGRCASYLVLGKSD